MSSATELLDSYLLEPSRCSHTPQRIPTVANDSVASNTSAWMVTEKPRTLPILPHRHQAQPSKAASSIRKPLQDILNRHNNRSSGSIPSYMADEHAKYRSPLGRKDFMTDLESLRAKYVSQSIPNASTGLAPEPSWSQSLNPSSQCERSYRSTKIFRQTWGEPSRLKLYDSFKYERNKQSYRTYTGRPSYRQQDYPSINYQSRNDFRRSSDSDRSHSQKYSMSPQHADIQDNHDIQRILRSSDAEQDVAPSNESICHTRTTTQDHLRDVRFRQNLRPAQRVPHEDTKATMSASTNYCQDRRYSRSSASRVDVPGTVQTPPLVTCNSHEFTRQNTINSGSNIPTSGEASLTDCLRDFFARQAEQREQADRENEEGHLMQSVASRGVVTTRALQLTGELCTEDSRSSGKGRLELDAESTPPLPCASFGAKISKLTDFEARTGYEGSQCLNENIPQNSTGTGVCNAANEIRRRYPTIFRPGQSPSFAGTLRPSTCDAFHKHKEQKSTTANSLCEPDPANFSSSFPDQFNVIPAPTEAIVDSADEQGRSCGSAEGSRDGRSQDNRLVLSKFGARDIPESELSTSPRLENTLSGLSERAQLFISAVSSEVKNPRQGLMKIKFPTLDASVDHWASQELDKHTDGTSCSVLQNCGLSRATIDAIENLSTGSL